MVCGLTGSSSEGLWLLCKDHELDLRVLQGWLLSDILDHPNNNEVSEFMRKKSR